jgi:hypothetical protein
MNQKLRPTPVVVVPVHRQQPTPDEQFGLQRCGQVLGHHPIRIVHPEGLNLELYKDLLPTAKPLPVPVAWMASIRAYNRMMINPAFYQKFDHFSHVLVHEPDALAISDQLFYWCEQPFDYIGAPWFEGFQSAASDAPIIGVGNSGFSLINIRAIRLFLDSNRRWISRMIIAKDLFRKILRRPSRYPLNFLIEAFGSSGLLGGAHRLVDDQCDLFLTLHASSSTPTLFRVADAHSALRFSWEVNPSRCSELCNNHLPFGIHAWAKYDRPFILDMLHYSPDVLGV